MKEKITMISKITYSARPINEKYYSITYEDEQTKKERYQMWKDIKQEGQYINIGYFGDYIIETYKYNNKYYELATNDDIGVMSYIKEYELEEK